jgi:hypothetical protein
MEHFQNLRELDIVHRRLMFGMSNLVIRYLCICRVGDDFWENDTLTDCQLKAIFKKHLSCINMGLERVKYQICYHSILGLTSVSEMALIKTRETNSLQLLSQFIFAVNSVLPSINNPHTTKNKLKSVTNKDQGWTNCSKFSVLLKTFILWLQ